MICRKFRSSSNWLGRKKDIKRFVDTPSAESYLYRTFADGTDRLDRVMDIKDIGKLEDNDILAQVNADIFDVEWSYAGLRANDGKDVDLTIRAACRITDPRACLNEYGIERLKAADTLHVTSLENVLIQSCRQPVSDEISTLSYDALRNQDALPVSWWQKKLPAWMDNNWLELKEIKSVRYESATADKEAQIKKQQKLQELEAEELAQQHERELTLKQQQAQFEAARKEIEADQKLNEKQRQAKLEKLDQERQQRKLQSELDIEKARLEAEKEKAEIEAEIEKIRHNTESANELMKEAQEAEKRNTAMLNDMKEAMNQLSEMASVTKEAVQESHETKERLGVSASNLSSRTMELLGKTAGPAYLAQIIREKAAAVSKGIMLKKLELQTRDIGTKKVDALAINSPLQFEFMPCESGYATVINIGTSGKVWLHSPNAYVGIEQAKVKAGEKYQVPGSLLPGEDLRRNGLDYIEVGPPGWEELAVIVTPKPLITETDIYKSTPQSPFSLMSPERVEAMLDQLADMPEDSWGAGILSFLVEA